MKKLFLSLILLILMTGLAFAGSFDDDVQMAPDGTYVGGEPEMAPDGSYVGGEPNLAPDGSYVGGEPDMAPDGSYVGTGRKGNRR